MKNQTLNVIKKFATKYQFTDELALIDAIREDIEAKDFKKEIEKILLSLYKSVINKITLTKDDERFEVAADDVIGATDFLHNAISAVQQCDDIKNKNVEEVNDFLVFESVIIHDYTDIKPVIIRDYTDIKPVRRIGTMSGKTNKKIDATYEKYKKYIIGGVIVIIAAGMISLFALSRNSKNVNNDNKTTKPGTEQSNTPSMPAPTKTPTTDDKTVASADTKIVKEEDIKSSAAVIYDSWSQITDTYTLNDIENVIRALYGLNSRFTIDEADEIIQNVIEIATVPRVNNILMGTPYEVKTVDVASLLLNNKSKLLSMQQILNVALSESDLETTAAAALKEEVTAYKYDGLKDLDAASRIIWARIATYLNAIHGTLGEDFYVEYNGKIYSQKDILESSFIEQIVKTAKSEIAGKTI